MFYRALGHTDIKKVLVDLSKSTLSRARTEALRRASISCELRAFADVFVQMQDLRHLADYSPSAEFDQSEVLNLIDSVDLALKSFASADPAELESVVALMLVGSRAA